MLILDVGNGRYYAFENYGLLTIDGYLLSPRAMSHNHSAIYMVRASCTRGGKNYCCGKYRVFVVPCFSISMMTMSAVRHQSVSLSSDEPNPPESCRSRECRDHSAFVNPKERGRIQRVNAQLYSRVAHNTLHCSECLFLHVVRFLFARENTHGKIISCHSVNRGKRNKSARGQFCWTAPTATRQEDFSLPVIH